MYLALMRAYNELSNGLLSGKNNPDNIQAEAATAVNEAVKNLGDVLSAQNKFTL